MPFGKVNYSSEVNSWATPQWIYDRLNKAFCFNLDVCADSVNTKNKNYYDKDDDGLSQPWYNISWCVCGARFDNTNRLKDSIFIDDIGVKGKLDLSLSSLNIDLVQNKSLSSGSNIYSVCKEVPSGRPYISTDYICVGNECSDSSDKLLESACDIRFILCPNCGEYVRIRKPVIFCNPPYGRGIDRWIEKSAVASAFGATIVVLVFARTDTHWFQDFGNAADYMLFVRGRLKFGDSKNSAPSPSVILVYGLNAYKIKNVADLGMLISV